MERARNEFIRNRLPRREDITKVKGLVEQFIRSYVCDVRSSGWDGLRNGMRPSLYHRIESLPWSRARDMEPSSGMLSFKLWDLTKDMAESNIMPISLMALSDASLGSSFIMSTSLLRSFPLRSTGKRYHFPFISSYSICKPTQTLHRVFTFSINQEETSYE